MRCDCHQLDCVECTCVNCGEVDHQPREDGTCPRWGLCRECGQGYARNLAVDDDDTCEPCWERQQERVRAHDRAERAIAIHAAWKRAVGRP